MIFILIIYAIFYHFLFIKPIFSFMLILLPTGHWAIWMLEGLDSKQFMKEMHSVGFSVMISGTWNTLIYKYKDVILELQKL